MAQARDTSTAPEEDALLKRTLLQQDGVLVRQAAMAAGQQALTELQRYYTEREEFYEASKVAYAGVLAVGYYAAREGRGSGSIDDALALLEQCESSTVESQQHLYNVLFLLSRDRIFFRDQTPEKQAHYRARMKELTADPAIRTDAFAIVLTEMMPKWMPLTGQDTKGYDPPHGGVNSETLTQACVLMRDKMLPQMQLACDQAVGARRDCLCINAVAFNAGQQLVYAPTAELWEPVQDKYLGANCEKLIEAVSSFSYHRHSSAARLVGYRMNSFASNNNLAEAVAERTGNLEQCAFISTNRDRQALEYTSLGFAAERMECSWYVFGRMPFLGRDGDLVDPTHANMVLRNLSGLGIECPHDAERLADLDPFALKYKQRSLDGLHCRMPLVGMIAVYQAALFLSTPPAQRSSFDTSFLDTLPAADNGAELVSTLLAPQIMSTFRAVLAEAEEEAGRPGEAIQMAQADLQDASSSFVQPSRVRCGRVLGRCHAALGQRELSSAALEAAVVHARAHRLRWSESLVAREMAFQQQQSGGGS